jgi:bifunctional non-homologous end joining protein LigD
VALDEDRRSKFNDLMFGRREPVYVAFDVLFVDGEDVRALPLKDRKALPEKMVRRHRLQRSEPVLGEGKTAFKAVCDLDLEGIVAKRLGDAYGPRTRWWKIPPAVGSPSSSRGSHLPYRQRQSQFQVTGHFR